MYFTTIEYITNNYIMYILQGAVERREGDHRRRRCAGTVVSVAVAGGVGIVVGRCWGWGGRIVTVDAGDGDRRSLSTALMVWWWSSSSVAMSMALMVWSSSLLSMATLSMLGMGVVASSWSSDNTGDGGGGVVAVIVVGVSEATLGQRTLEPHTLSL